MAKGLKFLLEIGTEEIPDWMIPPALEHLTKAFAGMLEKHKLPGRVSWVDATPRRLVLAAEKIEARQKDSVDVVTGPPKSAGEGAAQGFARKNGVTVDQLETVATAKGEYFAVRKQIVGRDTSEILAAELAGLILGIPWPKTMFWTKKGGPRFIRPIRWIVALLGSGVIRFEVAGIESGETSQGHRIFGKKKVKVSVAGYEKQMARNGVVVRSAQRRQTIENGVEALLGTGGLRLKPDAALLETLVFLTELPTPILGSFDRSYLGLPAEVLVTVMRHHQKYFSVTDADGNLAPHFIAVMNAPSDPEGLVVSGNERVLRARFNDARFFWEVDQNRKLADRVEDLKNVTFQRDIGSYHAKAERVVALAGELGGNEHARRAALLAKTDLTTDMVKEFTDLQGIVGGLYARAQGEPEAVARAIYDHYKPVSMEDSIPASEEGRIVALADKLDTLRSCLAVGMMPTGSKDPFALRRAAQGVIKILVEGGMATPFASLAGGNRELEEFLLDRVRHYFREIRGFRYDEVNAVLAAGVASLPDVLARLEAIRAVRPTPDFEPLAASFKRIGNILDQAGTEASRGTVDASLLTEPAEQGLHTAMQQALAVQESGSYEQRLAAIASLRPAVDLFFDKVLVNAPEAPVRANRLALLDTLRRGFSRIADFSEIVTG
ncbi:MAG: glycine--tRNA ligase subunit beta [Bryobacteraceae bacterium]